MTDGYFTENPLAVLLGVNSLASEGADQSDSSESSEINSVEFPLNPQTYELNILLPEEYFDILKFVTYPKEPPLVGGNRDIYYSHYELWSAHEVYAKLDSAALRGLNLDVLSYSEQYLYERSTLTQSAG